MLIAALLVVAKKWKQPKCPASDKWINKMVYPHNRIFFNNEK